MVIPSIAADGCWQRLIETLAASKGTVHVSGLWGSSAPMVAAAVAFRSPGSTLLYITGHLEQADNARDDTEFFLGQPCDVFPAWETLPGEGAASGEIEAERLRICSKLLEVASRSRDASAGGVLVTPIQAIMQPVPSAEMLRSNTLHLRVGQAISARSVMGSAIEAIPNRHVDELPPGGPDAVLAWGIDRGLARLDLVESPGDVARRGDIVDLFLPGEADPFRIQFDGDAVESIRRFDVGTQRSIESLDHVSFSMMADERRNFAQHTSALTEFLPPETIVVLDQPGEVHAMGETLYQRLGRPERLFTATDVLSRLDSFRTIHLSNFAPAATSDETVLDMGVTSLSRFEGGASDAIAELRRIAAEHHVHIVCDAEGERQRLREMLAEEGAANVAGLSLHVGVVHRGFEWTRTRTIVLPHHELFQRQRPGRRLRRVHAARPIETWLDLTPGDYVVHVLHGIAIYRGLKRMRKGESAQEEEFLALEFDEKAFVYVPCSQIDLVQKYIGASGRKPKLSRIGGKRWSRAKQQVSDAVSDLAESLIRVQAIREESTGVPFPPDTEWQREFEAAFPYDETEDQLLVAGEIRDDLTRPRPMDRLVCGDVGYGKTELAMRAAFKVVEFGRQVAVLVPTTVLAEQHYETFRERMAQYPFVIRCLSRFRTTLEQKRIVEQLKKGQVDIVIGTHRLVSKDVKFANLGLIVIDEEQRFGVEHKERLKAMRETVDVLTLTATPIPRTLHMALMGIRDISSLQTPPVDRRSIATQVGPFNKDLIRNAILREMNRDGQVYFLHNYVQSIAAMANDIRAIVPEARVVFGHGQMNDAELESVMHEFVQRRAEVLVSTTIIESGIDIPTVNTIFINRADRFGLADLHQLRGRVGRSSSRAHCYLLLSPDRPPTGKAAKRLKTIEEFSELGAGFRIAMRDLEIRGAGNLLGREQSGNIAVVGYEMYCRLLEQAVRRLKDEPDPTPPPVQVDLDVAAHIPRHYITADRSRIEIYRRIVSCRSEPDLTQLERDLVDAFGPYPKEVDRLLQLAEIRVYARRYGVQSISLKPPDVVFVVERISSAEPVFIDAPGSVRMPDPKTVHLRMPRKHLETDTLLPVLRRMFVRAGERMKAPL